MVVDWTRLALRFSGSGGWLVRSLLGSLGIAALLAAWQVPRTRSGAAIGTPQPSVVPGARGNSGTGHSGSALKIQPAPPGMPFGVHIDVITSMANLEVFFLSPRYPRPPGAPPW
jgi:hypothetical protein